MSQKRRYTPAPPVENRQLTRAEIEIGIQKLSRRIEQLKGLNPELVRFTDTKVDVIESNIQGTILEIFGENSPEYREHRYLRIWHGGLNLMDLFEDRQEKFAQGIPQTLTILEGLISRLKERLDYLPASGEMAPVPRAATSKEYRQIFIVHGRDELNTLKLKELLQTRWDLEPIILSGEPGKGRTLIEKFEQEAQKVVYAFILFTPDDLIEVKGTTYTQARPNTIFELGWFYGRLTRQKVCILFKRGTKIPSDLDGISRIEFDNAIDEKIIEIERELKAAKLI